MKKLVAVRFSGTPYKNYVFFTEDETLETGDKVVVETVHGLEIATVQNYVEDADVAVTKWVVQKIDLTEHKARVEKQNRAAALKKKMAARQKQLEEVKLFALLAESDPEMKALFTEFTSIND